MSRRNVPSYSQRFQLVANKSMEVVRIYLPPDVNCLLAIGYLNCK
ncbi:hypothetical protein [Chamaesiphon sp.]